jgi:hypothetical protein
MSEMDKVKSDQVEPALRDLELDAVTGGIGAAIGGKSAVGNEEAAGTQPIRHYSIGFGAPF